MSINSRYFSTTFKDSLTAKDSKRIEIYLHKENKNSEDVVRNHNKETKISTSLFLKIFNENLFRCFAAKSSQHTTPIANT